MTELVGIITGLVAALAMLLLLLGLGYWLARDELAADRKAVEQQREALDAEWRALDSARRVGDVFFAARRAMQAEVQRRPRARRR